MDAAKPTLTHADDQPSRPPRVLVKKHPLAIRWFHWINFPVLFLMIWSGLLIYWANSVFNLPGFVTVFFKHFGWNVGPLFPDSWWSPHPPNWLLSPHAPSWLRDSLVTTTVDQDDAGKDVAHHFLWSFDSRLAEGMGWHFLFAWLFVLNGFAYVSYLALSGEWRTLVPKRRALVEAIQVVLVDLHLSKKKLPVRKYNAAQQIAYTAVILMGVVMVLTGIAIYKPSEQSWLTHLFFGYTVARFIHFWTTMGFLAFFVIHVGQVVKTGWNNFRGMVTGYELVTPEEKEQLR